MSAECKLQGYRPHRLIMGPEIEQGLMALARRLQHEDGKGSEELKRKKLMEMYYRECTEEVVRMISENNGQLPVLDMGWEKAVEKNGRKEWVYDFNTTYITQMRVGGKDTFFICGKDGRLHEIDAYRALLYRNGFIQNCR